jgi:hypothetical protein
MRHLHCFASTILDRVYLLTEHLRKFDVEVHGLDELHAQMRPDRGLLLLGAHVGSFEVLRAMSFMRPDVKVRVVLDTLQTPAMTEMRWPQDVSSEPMPLGLPLRVAKTTNSCTQSTKSLAASRSL